MTTHELDEWRREVGGMSEADRAPFDDPQKYADTFDLNGDRHGFCR
jgi:hypothetical protein